MLNVHFTDDSALSTKLTQHLVTSTLECLEVFCITSGTKVREHKIKFVSNSVPTYINVVRIEISWSSLISLKDTWEWVLPRNEGEA
jgi:hypothetical protein